MWHFGISAWKLFGLTNLPFVILMVTRHFRNNFRHSIHKNFSHSILIHFSAFALETFFGTRNLRHSFAFNIQTFWRVNFGHHVFTEISHSVDAPLTQTRGILALQFFGTQKFETFFAFEIQTSFDILICNIYCNPFGTSGSWGWYSVSRHPQTYRYRQPTSMPSEHSDVYTINGPAKFTETLWAGSRGPREHVYLPPPFCTP